MFAIISPKIWEERWGFKQIANKVKPSSSSLTPALGSTMGKGFQLRFNLYFKDGKRDEE